MDKLTQELNGATWRKSTLSGPDGGNCVEIANISNDRKGVRDSKNPTGPVLIFTTSEWEAFIEGVKCNEFN